MLNILFLDPTSNNVWIDCIAAFTNELGTNGWEEGTDYTIQLQGPNYGQTVQQALTNFVNLGTPNPNDFIILTGGTGPTVACIQATQPVPGIKIFFATAGEPGTYFTALGNNVTGISNEQTDPNLVRQRLKHMKTYVPLADNAVFGVIGNRTVPNVLTEIPEIVSAAATQAIKLQVVTSNTPVNTVANITTAIQDVQGNHAQAVYVCTDPWVTSYAPTINQVASQYNLPTMHAFSKNAVGSTSGLFLGFELTDLFSQAADMIYNWRVQGGALPNPTTPTKPPKHQP